MASTSYKMKGQNYNYAQGHSESDGTVKISFSMPDGMFKKIDKFAKRYDMSFASAVRELVSRGFEE